MTMRLPDQLWHYTCVDHGLPGILDSGCIRPNDRGVWSVFGPPLLWLTDIDLWIGDVDPVLVGLTGGRLTCNRTAVRFHVPRRSPGVSTWRVARIGFTQDFLVAFESFGDPAHWWVGTRPIEVGPDDYEVRSSS